MAILRSILYLLLLSADMPSHATTVHGASMLVAARPGAATRALDAAGAVLGDISNVTADGRKKNKGKTGPRKLRPPIEQLRNALTLYVTVKYTVALPITQKKAGAKFGVEAHQMQKMTLKITADTFEGKLAQIAGLEWSLPGRPDVVAGVYFDKDEQDIIAAVVAERCRMGFPLDAEGLGAYCAELLVKLGRGTDSTTGKPRKCSAHWVRDFIKEHNLASYKSSAIDPARARQATPEVRDTFFDLVDEVTAREFAAGKITWATFAQVPDTNKYNMDEKGKDANKGRKSVLGRAPAPKKKTNESFVDAAAEAPLRVYERTDGDHAPHHFTNVETSCATGVCVIPDGIVHSSPGNENPSMTLALLENIVVLATTDELRASPYHRDGYVRLECIEVYVSQSGSMTRAIFPRWCEHFVRNLPTGQGKGGEKVFLFLDGHTSLWCYAALDYLYDNNVICICLPSHTSIWSQPNDAGQNASFKCYYADVVRAWRYGSVEHGFTSHAGCVMNRSDSNAVFVAARRGFKKRQEDMLQVTGSNSIRSGWTRVGLAPYNKYCYGWTEAIEGLGRAAEVGSGRSGDHGAGHLPALPTPAEIDFDVVADLAVLSSDQLATLVVTRHPGETAEAAAVRLVGVAVRRWQESPGNLTEPGPISVQEDVAFKCAPPTRRGGVRAEEFASMVVALARGKLESAPTGASFLIDDAAPTLAEGDCVGLTAADKPGGAARATMVRGSEQTFTVIYADAVAYPNAVLSLSNIVAGVGTRFVVIGTAELAHEKTIEAQKANSRAARRVEARLLEAKKRDLRREGAAITLDDERAFALALGVGAENLEKIRDKITKQRPVTIGEYIVAPVPQGRAIVVHRLVLDFFREPFAELHSGRQAAKRPRRRGSVPDTTKDADCGAVMLQLHAFEAADLKDRAEKEARRACKVAARDGKKTIELRAALGDLIDKSYDIAKLTLSKIKPLLEWRAVPVPKPWKTETKHMAVAAWEARKFDRDVLSAEHQAMLIVLASEEDDEDMSDEEDEDEEDAAAYTTSY